MIDLPDEFTAIDPEKGFKVKVKANKTAGGFWVYEYGASSPRFLMADTVRALIQYGCELERKRINQEESCPDCGESFSKYVLNDRGWGNKPIPEERGKELLEKYRSKNEESEK